MSEEIELIKEVAGRLKKAGIDYMMTGSMAMAVHSMPRMTRDIDVVIQVSPDDIIKIVKLFENDFYIDEGSVRQAIHNRDMFNIIHNESVIKVDFIVRKNEAYRIEEFSRRQQIDIEGVSVFVVAAEDLMLSKLVWAKDSESELQLRDVRQMVANLKNLDYDYMDKWAAALGVNGMLEKVQGNE
jgi:predicted nucleotidyltransferase